MANYDENKLTKLGDLKALAQRVKDECASQEEVASLSETIAQIDNDVNALEGKVEVLESTEGEKNVIIGVKVNDSDVQIGEDRIVKIYVPKDTGDLTNNAGFQNATDVETAVTNGINTWAEKATDNQTIDTFKELVEYVADHQDVAGQLVVDVAQAKTDISKNTENISANTSDIIGLKELVGEESVTEQIEGALTGYVKEEALSGYVPKEGEKVLSTNDYTSEDKAKVDSIVFADDSDITNMLDEVFAVDD